MQQSKKKVNFITVLTLYATFLMGFIDSYTFLEKKGVFVSAQTGNMIVFASKLFTGQFRLAFGHITVFFGFALGTFLGEIILERDVGSTKRKYQLILVLQSLILFIFAIIQSSIFDSLMIFLLGGLAGLELDFFRKVGVFTVNDGIMTGNTKNWSTNLYKWLIDKDKNSKKKFFELSLVLLFFIFGVGIGSIIILFSDKLNLWIAFILNTIFLIWLFNTRTALD